MIVTMEQRVARDDEMVPVGMQATAEKAVEALLQREQVGELPEYEVGWNSIYISAIRACKEQYRGSPDLAPLLDIASEKLYGRDIHWALELIQNAEDEDARRIVFVFDDDAVYVLNL